MYVYYAFERSSSIEFIIRDENFFQGYVFRDYKSFKFFFFFLMGLVVLLRRCDGRDRREYNDV